jgi:membrane-associated phospholipid phosphatase
MKTYIFIFLVFIGISMYGQTQADKSPPSLFWAQLKYDGGSILKGIGHAYSRPAHWKKEDWLTFGGVVAGGLILYQFDGETSDFFVNQESKAPHLLKEIGWYYGSPQNFFMLSTALYGYGMFAKNDKVRHTGLVIITSAAATGIMQTLLKNGIGRARPSQGIGSSTFDPFNKESGYHSFPSGHSILSFTASHAIARQFDNFWVKSGIYAVGLIAPVSRLWAGAHWLTDVTLGMVFSIAVVDSVDKFLKQERSDGPLKEKRVNWNIQVRGNGIGLVGVF